jgi:CBS domain-containing protein
MATINELVRGRDIHYVTTDAIVLDAARYMSERNIGAVPVLNDGRLVGIFSERDIMNRVLIGNCDPQTTRVADVMTADPQVVNAEESIDRCMLLMKQHGFRHLPVCDGDRLVGFLSLRDLLLHDLDEKEVEVRMMRSYMSAIPE